MNSQDSSSHQTRKLLIQYIHENPGTTFQHLKYVFNLNEGTLRYHLNFLLRKEEINQVKKGNIRSYVPVGLLRAKNINEKQRFLYKLIENNPGISRKELFIQSKQSRKKLSYNISRLIELGLIWKVKGENNIGYSIITKDQLYKESIGIIFEKLLNEEIDTEKYLILKSRLEKTIFNNNEII